MNRHVARIALANTSIEFESVSFRLLQENFDLRVLILALSFCLFTYAAPAEASYQKVVTAYKGCMQFLKMSRDRQAEVARRTPYSLSQTLWGCNLMKKNGLAKSLYLEGVYDQWKKDSAAWERANRNRRSSNEDERTSHSHSTGTCYSGLSCTGSATETNARVMCPGTTSSFKPQIGGSCERY